MNCINHPETPAVAYCRTCGKALCEACQNTALGTVYCAEHLPATASAPVVPQLPAQPQPNPPVTGYVPPFPPLGTPAPTPSSAGAAPPPSGAIPPGAAPAGAWTAPGSQAGPPWVPAASPYTSTVDPGASPGLAFILGMIPGVGAVYNGQYVKGLMHVIILGILISIVSSDSVGPFTPLFGMLIAIWWFYMAFEAYHTARRRQFGQPVDEFSSIVPLHSSRRGFPAGPVLLIAFGVLFLLNTMNWLRFDQIVRYWPVLLIVLGAYMLYERLTGSTPSAPPQQEMGHEPR